MMTIQKKCWELRVCVILGFTSLVFRHLFPLARERQYLQFYLGWLWGIFIIIAPKLTDGIAFTSKYIFTSGGCFIRVLV